MTDILVVVLSVLFCVAFLVALPKAWKILFQQEEQHRIDVEFEKIVAANS